MNEENERDCNVEGDTVESPVVCVSRVELIAAIGGVGIQVMAEICQIVIDGFGMSVEWTLSIMFPIIKGRGTSGTAAAMQLQFPIEL